MFCRIFRRHSRLLRALSRSFSLIRKLLHQFFILMISSRVIVGLTVLVSNRFTHFSLKSTFLYRSLCPFLLAFWYLISKTRYLFMLGPLKYNAESQFPVPVVVALDVAMYTVPGLLPSNPRDPGSMITLSTAFRGWPLSTGPADWPWNVCKVMPKDNSSGQKVTEQHPLSQRSVIIGIGTICVAV